MPETTMPNSINPFVHHIKLSKFQKLQVLLMSVTIAPLRFILAFLLFTITWSLAVVFTINADTSKPASPVRQSLYQFLQYLGRSILFVCGFQYINIKGQRASYHEAPILLTLPHSSFWDIIVFFVTSPLPSALSKFENFHIPIFGTLMKAVQPILVQRSDVSSKNQTVNEIKDRLSSNFVWPQLVIFPEGTCTNKKTMLKFKLGAFLAGTAIQPVIIRYQKNPDVSTWTEISPGAFYLIWLSFCQIHINVEIEYLPVYKPSVQEKNDPKLYAFNVQQYLIETLDMPCTDCTYEDRLLMKQAGKLKLPKEIAFIRFFNIKKTFNINIQDATKRLKEFAEISSNRFEGVISLKDLFHYLKLSTVKELQQLMQNNGLDVGDERISFYQYILLYYTLIKNIEKEENFLPAYDVYRQARVKRKNAVIIQEIIDTMNLDTLMSEEEFKFFCVSHPFYGNLLLHCRESVIPTSSLSEDITLRRVA